MRGTCAFTRCVGRLLRLLEIAVSDRRRCGGQAGQSSRLRARKRTGASLRPRRDDKSASDNTSAGFLCDSPASHGAWMLLVTAAIPVWC